MLFPKKITAYLDKEVTNPYSQRKKNNQSQNHPTHRYNWLEKQIPLVGHRSCDPCSNDKLYWAFLFLSSAPFFPNHHSSLLQLSAKVVHPLMPDH